MSIFRGSGNLIETASSHLMYKISNEQPSNHDYVMKSGALVLLSTPFQKTESTKDLHQNVCKLMLQLSFQNQDRKKKLVQDNFLLGLVPLLNHYSNPDFFDSQMVSLVLKCMANFSLIDNGVEILLKDNIIPAFKTFFSRYKEDYDD